ncbi:MAG TPA: hypothetical protein VMG12_15740, partial [Polyangiaceae bacterium]|nr:hypothetical protein [Polyangiaceae bacterium]
ALAPQPEGRYRSASDMRSDLEHYLASRDAAVSDSAIAALVCAGCREHRREMERAIEARAGELGLSLPPAAAERSSAALAAGSPAARSRARFDRVERGSALLAAGIVAASVIIALVLASTLARDASPASALPGSRAATPAGAAVADPTERSSVARLVRLDVRVQPSHAVLSIDGQRLSSNPLLASMVWDPHWHTLRGEAAGFEPFVAQFRLDSDVKIDASLRREASGAVQRQGERSAPVAQLRPRAKATP